MRDLGLSGVQRSEMFEAMRTSHAATRDLLEGYEDGNVTAEGVRDGMRAADETLREQLAQILDDEQRESLAAMHEERRERMAGHREEVRDDRADHRADLLTEILRLNERQSEKISSLMATAAQEHAAVGESLGDGKIEPWDAVYQGLQIQERTDAAIRDVLDDDQTVKFDALRSLLPDRGRHGPAWGPPMPWVG
jgi:hypothetical protein